MRQKVKAADEESYRALQALLDEQGRTWLRDPQRLTLVAEVSPKLRPQIVALGGRRRADRRYSLD